MGCRIQGSGSRVLGFGFRVGFRVLRQHKGISGHKDLSNEAVQI